MLSWPNDYMEGSVGASGVTYDYVVNLPVICGFDRPRLATLDCIVMSALIRRNVVERLRRVVMQ